MVLTLTGVAPVKFLDLQSSLNQDTILLVMKGSIMKELLIGRLTWLFLFLLGGKSHT